MSRLVISQRTEPHTAHAGEGGRVRPNRFFDTDAHVLPCAAHTRLVCAGQVER
jgi:hypothetical protein